MANLTLFEVLEPGVGGTRSIIIPSAAARGLFWSANTAVATTADGQITAKLAAVSDQQVLGFNEREVTSTGLRSDTQILWETGLEGYDKAAQECSVGPLPELFAAEVDDSNTVVSSTNPPTAVNDIVGFTGGKVHIAQSGEYAHYIVVGVETGSLDATKSRLICQKLTAPHKVA